jgi:hypothetical protein
MLSNETFKHMGDLPIHKKLCRELLEFFYQRKEINGAFLSGSGASGGMDFHSDLDFGFLCTSEEAKGKIWQERFDLRLPPWFHRMDADHVKPYFIIYLFDPHVHVDLCFYTMENLPPQAGGPFTVAFDKQSQLGDWISEVNNPLIRAPDWSNLVHEEEQFWTWIHYDWCHVGRGEYYDGAAFMGVMRDVLHRWYARLNGDNQFNTRRLEHRGETAFIESMRECFPTPDRASMKAALLNLIKIHNQQRAQVEGLVRPTWKTTQSARDKITHLVREL